MESQFKPSGWLGALMGTRLYFDMSDARRIPAKIPSLIKELGNDGRPTSSDGSQGDTESAGGQRSRLVVTAKAAGADSPENWSSVEVRTYSDSGGPVCGKD